MKPKLESGHLGDTVVYPPPAGPDYKIVADKGVKGGSVGAVVGIAIAAMLKKKYPELDVAEMAIIVLVASVVDGVLDMALNAIKHWGDGKK